MHNLTLGDELSMVQDTVRKLVQDVIEPAALEHDEHRGVHELRHEAISSVLSRCESRALIRRKTVRGALVAGESTRLGCPGV